MSLSDVQRRLHSLFHPLLKEALNIVHVPIGGLIARRRAAGWRTDFTKRLDRALARFCDRLELEKVQGSQELRNPETHEEQQLKSIIPVLAPEARKFCELVLVLSDLERYHFPIWWDWLMEELKREDLVREEGGQTYGSQA